MTNIMSKHGYAFARIEIFLNRDIKNKTVNVDFIINKTPKIYINNITISGNHITLDKIIRRELRFREGDFYNIDQINRSKQRILHLGFFDDVNININRDGSSNRVNIDVVVKERKTGELTFGVGYSTTDRLTW